jgi:molecular chaperone GrpE
MSEDQSLPEETNKPATEPEDETLEAAVKAEGDLEAEFVELLSEASPAEELAEQLELATQKAEQFRDQHLRTQAEMENLRRRTEKEVQDARKFAVERFAKDLLVVLDSLELGILAAAGDSPEVVKLREGSELTLKQFQQVLEKYNVQPIDAQGQKFNPALHQAMTMEPTNEVEPNTITKVFQKGYTINERLLRPAMVVIAQKA